MITLVGCTVSGNSALEGGGVLTWNGASMTRCVLWGNLGSVGPEIQIIGDSQTEMLCTAVDTTGVDIHGELVYDASCIFTDPEFCDLAGRDYSLHDSSPCLPEHSPCGQLVGALGVGCGPPTGACCLASGACVVVMAATCEAAGGGWMGSGSACDPNPCEPVPTRASSWGRLKERYRVIAR